MPSTRRIAVMVRGKALRVPLGADPDEFAAKHGVALRRRPDVFRGGPTTTGVEDRHRATFLADTVLSNLAAQLEAGNLMPARQAAARLGGGAFAAAVAKRALTVHVVRGRRYVVRAAVESLVRPRYARGASKAISDAIDGDKAQRRPTRPKRERRIPDWAKTSR